MRSGPLEYTSQAVELCTHRRRRRPLRIAMAARLGLAVPHRPHCLKPIVFVVLSKLVAQLQLAPRINHSTVACCQPRRLDLNNRKAAAIPLGVLHSSDGVVRPSETTGLLGTAVKVQAPPPPRNVSLTDVVEVASFENLLRQEIDKVSRHMFFVSSAAQY